MVSFKASEFLNSTSLSVPIIVNDFRSEHDS